MVLIALISAFSWSAIDNWHALHSEDADTVLQINEQAVHGCRDAWLSQDKFVHCSASVALSGFSYYYLISYTATENSTARLTALSLGACVGFGKELYDRENKGCFSWKDLVWDGVGLCLGFAMFMR